MKIAICDDDKRELSRILSLLDLYCQKQNLSFSICPFRSSFELAASAQTERYDVYLLDIIMPGLTGMQLAKEIRSFDKAADIVFLTTTPDFAVESYTVKATNYLMKPIVQEQFFQVLDDIMETRVQEQGKVLVLKSTIGMHKVSLSNLMYLEAQGRKVVYYLSNGESITCTDRFATVCEQLLQHPEFLLIHRSFLVNMNYIRMIGMTDLNLQNGTALPLAQRRVSEIKTHYLTYQMEEMS